MPTVTTLERFIKQAKLLHGERYDYSGVVYVNAKTLVKFVCKLHGAFNQSPDHHLRGYGCRKCGTLRTKQKRLGTKGTAGSYRKATIEEFIASALLKHGNKFDYSNSVYVDSKTKIEIKCTIHGSFWQTPGNHLYGFGCKACRNLMTQDEFINRSVKLHHNKFDYTKTKYTHNKIPVTITCPKHGDFNQIPYIHSQGKGCPSCSRSKGEEAIALFLDTHRIVFEPQYSFNDCISPKTGRKLRFDFFIPSLNTLIEYDGKQHFDPAVFWCKNPTEEQLKKSLKEFRARRKKDTIKTKYAKSKSIRLIRISYRKRRTIAKVLLGKLGLTARA